MHLGIVISWLLKDYLEAPLPRYLTLRSVINFVISEYALDITKLLLGLYHDRASKFQIAKPYQWGPSRRYILHAILWMMICVDL